jgi:uncharacterized protein
MNDHNLKPVTAAELVELEDFLLSGRAARHAMDLDMLDGFFAALAVGPESLQPEQWLPLVWGPEREPAPEFDSIDEMHHVLSLMVRYKRLVESVLHGDPESYLPLFARCSFAGWEEEREAVGNWAKGFLIGIEPVRETWQPLFEEDTEFAAIAPVFMLAGLDGERDIDEERWLQCRDAAADSVRSLCRFWSPFRGKTGKSGSSSMGEASGR